MLERLAYLLLISALAIVGIAMSSHSATPTVHASTAPVSMTANVLDVEHGHPSPFASHVDSEPPGVPGSACVDCAGDHSSLLMACAFLALLLVVSVALPALAMRFGVLAPGLSRLDDIPRRVAAARPPDLAELCISRQ